MEGRMIDTRTREGRKALAFLSLSTRQLLDLLGIDPNGPEGRTHYPRGELCLMCAERGLKVPLI